MSSIPLPNRKDPFFDPQNPGQNIVSISWWRFFQALAPVGTGGGGGTPGPPGPPGPVGHTGATGATGPSGPVSDDFLELSQLDLSLTAGPGIGLTPNPAFGGPIIISALGGLQGAFQAEDGEDGWPGPPGLPGAAGAAGTAGVAGATVIGPQGDDGEDGWLLPGPTGAVGPQGPTGSSLALGPPGMQGDDGEDGWLGPPGAASGGGTVSISSDAIYTLNSPNPIITSGTTSVTTLSKSSIDSAQHTLCGGI